VEYNTSTNPTFEGAVRDTSGRGLDGVIQGDVSYDATEKAFTGFTRVSSKTISTPIHNTTSGDYNFSVSTWVKPLSYDGVQGIFNIGPPLGTNVNTRGQTAVRLESSGFLKYYVWGYGTNNSSYTYKLGAWIHVVATYSGGSSGQKLYVDGVELDLDAGNQGELDLLSGAHLHIGHLVNGTGALYGSRGLNGSLSNFKLYDCALTAEEVKRLYDMGRNGSVANPQPLHIAAPLYSPGTIVQVEQSIKTDTFSTTGASSHPVSPGNDVPGLAVTIHPKFANSKILVSYTVSTGAYGRAYLRIQRKQGGSTTTIAPSVGPEANTQNQGKCTTSHSGSGDSSVDSQSFEYYDTIGGTEPITYQIQAWTYHAVYYVYVNRGHDDGNGSNNGTYWARTLSSITAKEVCQ